MQLNQVSSKYQFLMLVHPAFGMSDLGKVDWRFSLRRSLNKFILSSHNLEIETGRFSRPAVPRHQRFCTYCLAQGVQVLGDEKHALDVCPQFQQDRILTWEYIRLVIPKETFAEDVLVALLQELDAFKISVRAKVWRAVAILMEKIQISKKR